LSPQAPGRKIKWGILGTARIAHDYVIPAIQASRNGVVAAVAGRREARVNSFAEEFSINLQFNNLGDLLDSDIDAVYIPLTNELHRDWTINAAEKGKHILCEKPLALNSKQCREMIAASRSGGVLLMEGFMYRFHPQIDALLAEISSGAIGDVKLVRSSFWFKLNDLNDFRYKKEQGGGALMDIGCYCVNVARMILHAEPSSCVAVSKMNETRDVDELTLGAMSFGTKYAYFDCGFTGPLYNSLQVIGSEGILELPEAFEFPQRPRMLCFANNSSVPQKTLEFPKANPYTLMVEHFSDCILDGRPPKYSPEDSLNNMKAIEKLKLKALFGGE
jgi:xylose dehydrogenase (NAD/NADP)